MANSPTDLVKLYDRMDDDTERRFANPITLSKRQRRNLRTLWAQAGKPLPPALRARQPKKT